MRCHGDEIIKSKVLSPADVEHKGILRTLRQSNKFFTPPSLLTAAAENELRVDVPLNMRIDRHVMQTEAEKGHAVEPRWTCVDGQGLEAMSSACSIVGFFVGYDVLASNKSSTITTSRKGQCEHNLDWKMVPPLCRPNLSGPGHVQAPGSSSAGSAATANNEQRAQTHQLRAMADKRAPWNLSSDSDNEA